MSKDNMMFVSRMDGPTTHGWNVRIERKTLTKRQFFSDSKYGGRHTALKAALKKRDDLVREHHVEMNHDGVLAFEGGKFVWRAPRTSDGLLT